jgi:hypothetical protein
MRGGEYHYDGGSGAPQLYLGWGDITGPKIFDAFLTFQGVQVFHRKQKTGKRLEGRMEYHSMR